MLKEDVDVLHRVAVSRAMAAVEDVLTEFRSREMGHVDAETLIEQIRARLHEDLLMLSTTPRPA